MRSMLRVKNVEKSFGGIRAVNGCSIRVDRGSTIGMIGPNGAGKSTLFDLITGFQKLDQGDIYFDGKRIDGLPPHEIAQRGLVRTFQISRPLSKMTVLDNMLLSPQGQKGENLINALFGIYDIEKQEKEHRARALGLLEFLGLIDLKEEYAGNLSAGQMKLLELARALMVDPEMLLLDEPIAGVNPTLAEELLKHIRELQEKGVTFLIVEHNMEAIMRVSEKIYVLENGGVIAEGTPEEIRANERVLDAYLGR
ncbi:MAG: ABC transporter ATP-binding protein [Candidatus Hydrothermarchaeaceae archaeon]